MIVAKQINELINEKGQEPQHYAKAYAAYIDSKTKVSRELQQIFLNLYRLGGLYKDTGEIDEEIFSRDYWNTPFMVKPLKINGEYGEFDPIMITGKIVASAINEKLGEDDPNTADIDMSVYNNPITVEEMLVQYGIDVSQLKAGMVGAVDVVLKTNIVLNADEMHQAGELLQVTNDDLKSLVKASVGNGLTVTISITEFLGDLTASVASTDSVIAILDLLGSNLQVSLSDVNAKLHSVLSNFSNYETYVNNSIASIASDTNLSINERIANIMMILRDDVASSEEENLNEVYFDDEVGMVFNSKAYSGTPASAMWNGSVASNAVQNVFLTTGAVIAATGKVIFNVTKQVANCVSRLWKKYVTPAYQSKDFVKSDFETVDKYVDVPLFVYGTAESGAQFDRHKLVNAAYQNLNTPVTKTGSLDLSQVTLKQEVASESPFLGMKTDQNGVVSFKTTYQGYYTYVDKNSPVFMGYYASDLGYVTENELNQLHGKWYVSNDILRLIVCNNDGNIVYNEVEQIGLNKLGIKHEGEGACSISFRDYLDLLPNAGRVDFFVRDGKLMMCNYGTDGWLNAGIDINITHKTVPFDAIYLLNESDYGYTTNGWEYPDPVISFIRSGDYKDKLSYFTAVIRCFSYSKCAWVDVSVMYDNYMGSVAIQIVDAGWLDHGQTVTDPIRPEQHGYLASSSNGLASQTDAKISTPTDRYVVPVTLMWHSMYHTFHTNQDGLLASNDGSVWYRESIDSDVWLNDKAPGYLMNLRTEATGPQSADFMIPFIGSRYDVELTYRPEFGNGHLLVYTNRTEITPYNVYFKNDWKLEFRSEDSFYDNGAPQFIWSDDSWTWYSAPVSSLSKDTVNQILIDASNPINEGTALTLKTTFMCSQFIVNDDKVRAMAYLVPIPWDVLLNSDGSWRITADETTLFIDGEESSDESALSWIESVLDTTQQPRVNYDAESGDITAYKDLFASKKLADMFIWCINNPNVPINEYFINYSSGYIFNLNSPFELEEVNNSDLVSLLYHESINTSRLNSWMYSVMLDAITMKPSYIRAYFLLTGEYPQFKPYLIGDRLKSPQWHVSTDSDIQGYVDKLCTIIVSTAMVIMAAVLLKVVATKAARVFKRKENSFNAKQLRLNQQTASAQVATENSRSQLAEALSLKESLGPDASPEDVQAFKDLVKESKDVVKKNLLEERKLGNAKIKLDRSRKRWARMATVFGCSMSSSEVLLASVSGDATDKFLIDTASQDTMQVQEFDVEIPSYEDNFNEVRSDANLIMEKLSKMSVVDQVQTMISSLALIESSVALITRQNEENSKRQFNERGFED